MSPLSRLALVVVLVGTTAANSFAQPNRPQPLLWAGDADGGIPFVFQDPDNPREVIGFEKDLADALARELNRPILFRQYAFDSLIPGLERGDFDLAMNGIEITPDRQQRVRFSRPYYLYQQQLVVRVGENRFKTIEDCRDKTFVIGTLGNTVAERILEKMQIDRRTYDEQDGPYLDLARGRIDGVLLDLPAALYYAAPDPNLKYSRRKAADNLQFAGPAFAEGYYGIAVKKGNDKLADEIDRALQKLQDSGALKRILLRWQLWDSNQYLLYTTTRVEGHAEAMSFAQYFPLLLQGAGTTILITLASMVLAIALGLPLALCRLYGPAVLRGLATMYVEFFRGIPVLLLLYFLYFGLAGIAPQLSLGPLQAAILGFGLNYAAYEAEIYRTGIDSIPVGQWEAAASLGMSTPLAFRRIILPQAVRLILPPMTNDLVALFKDTSVVSIIAVVELSKQYQILTKSGGGYLQIGLTTAALYLIMSVPLGYLSRGLEKRWGKGHG